jgi:hypothetical protein
MPPGIADSLAMTFYFLFYLVIFWMIEYSFAYAYHALEFSWLVVFACAAAFSYGTVWLDKRTGY